MTFNQPGASDHQAPTPNMPPPTRVVFADELTEGMVLVDRCGGYQDSFSKGLVLDCRIDATSHGSGKTHQRVIHRLRRPERGMGLPSAVVVDEDGNQQPWRAPSRDEPVRVLA